MKPLDRTYGELIRLDPEDSGSAETLQRIPLGASAADGGVAEAFLQDLLFRFPETLPTAAIDAAYAGAVPVCRELSTPAGYVDALYVNPLGRLTLAEFKLWRNPQARREVIGQILDYAKELASWGYEDLQREVSKTLKRPGNVLYELVRERAPDEAAFIDRVTRHLKRGEFLLLIVGDGIREDVGDWGLSFVGFLEPSRSRIGCYLSCRKDMPHAVRVYGEIEASVEELRAEMGQDLTHWEISARRPRVGFRRSTKPTLLSEGEGSEDFREAVSWMQEHLNTLVSTLHPRLQRMLAARS